MNQRQPTDKSVMITNFENSNLYRSRIHDLIPGGAHTYSKGDDQFPELSPAAIAYGKGAYIWDIDGNKYLDCAMGLTSVSLGHAYEPVLKRVIEELYKGVNFQRPAAIEKEMAESFLSLVECHDMIKFAKNGSTVTTAAVKLARGYTGRDLVAFPYDHPFYSYDDWFIGQTPCNLGVPPSVASLSVRYKSDDLESLRSLLQTHPGQIACVISEPEKNHGIPSDYLQKAIELAHAYGALYITDEMITGYKTDFPGSIKKFNVQPDMATWGKGIANGFSFCALTGKKEIMELGGIRREGKEKLFLISTTHGAETHSIAAALATMEIFSNEPVVEHNQNIGSLFIHKCTQVITAANLQNHIQLVNCPWMPIVVFKDSAGQVSDLLRTLMMQEMIRRGVLFTGVFAPSWSHTEEDVAVFTDALSKSMKVYSMALEDEGATYLVGNPAKAVFRKFL